MPGIILENLNKIYKTQDREVKAIDNLSLRLNDHEFISLIGPSGSGKSTLLKIIAGNIKADSGNIYFDRQCVNDVINNKQVVLISDHFSLFPHLSIIDNLKLLNLADDSKIYNLCLKLKISDQLNQKVSSLSLGQSQRASLAFSLLKEPSILLLDETFANIDIELRKELLFFLKNYCKDKAITCIYVTHQITETMILSDHIVFIDKGNLVQYGDINDFIRRPYNLLIAKNIHVYKYNILKAKLINNFIQVDRQNIILNKAYNYQGDVDLFFKIDDFKIDQESDLVGIITDIKYLAHLTYLVVSIAEQDLLLKISDGVDYKIGEEINLAIDMDKIFIFDINGNNLEVLNGI